MTSAWLRHRWLDARTSFRGTGLDVAIWSAVTVALGMLIFSIAIAQAAVLVAGLLWGYALLRGRRCAHWRSPLLLPYSLFVLARIAAIPLSIDPAASADAFRTEIFFYVLFYVLLCTLDAHREDRLRTLLLLLFVAGLVATGVAFVKYALGVDERLTSTTAGYYTLGLFLTVLFAMAFALGRRRDIFPDRTAWLALCALLLLGLLFTFNRMHWVVAAIAALVVGLLRERRILAVLAVAGVLALIAVEPLQQRFLQLLSAGDHMSGRDVIWRGAFMLIDERPLTGFGLRTFHQVFPLFDQAPDKGIGSWHNDYLQVYMDSGLLALLPFIAILAVAGFMGWRNHRAWPTGS
ncbi:MAG: O-antigen ligase family protein, partial [Bacteroidota bacterium]|nr:O-antigen ligase family protein [Bacteroidota bacterium]